MKYVDENALRQNITETKDYVDNHGFASDRTPIGTIISVGCDSSLIPSSTIKYPTDDYFICKGTTLNIAEYPALADYFEDAFGSKNYFGGDGTTTFKVPDFTTDFPTNGILAIKAQMTSTQITYAEVNDSLTTDSNVWSAEKVNQSLQDATAKLARVSTRWYNTGTDTSVLTDIATNTSFTIIALIMTSAGECKIEGCGKRFASGEFTSTTNMLSESNGYVLFNPSGNNTRVMMLVYRGTSDGDTH